MRGATQKCCYRKFGNDISIHAPRAGRDAHLSHRLSGIVREFQSTRPVRGATYGARLQDGHAGISIHAPRAGRDVTLDNLNSYPTIFQSTRPVRGATVCRTALLDLHRISIHAPRAGRDSLPPAHGRPRRDFNPRAPCGARQQLPVTQVHIGRFQSTRPVRGATGTAASGRNAGHISIHAPRAGRDRHPDGVGVVDRISIHAPRAGRDYLHGIAYAPTLISIHAPRAGRDHLII